MTVSQSVAYNANENTYHKSSRDLHYWRAGRSCILIAWGRSNRFLSWFIVYIERRLLVVTLLIVLCVLLVRDFHVAGVNNNCLQYTSALCRYNWPGTNCVFWCGVNVANLCQDSFNADFGQADIAQKRRVTLEFGAQHYSLPQKSFFVVFA
jgi:hypothetical protein